MDVLASPELFTPREETQPTPTFTPRNSENFVKHYNVLEKWNKEKTPSFTAYITLHMPKVQ